MARSGTIDAIALVSEAYLQCGDVAVWRPETSPVVPGRDGRIGLMA